MLKTVLLPSLLFICFSGISAHADNVDKLNQMKADAARSPGFDDKPKCEYYIDCIRDGRSIVDEPYKPREIENAFGNPDKGSHKSISGIVSDQLKTTNGR